MTSVQTATATVVAAISPRSTVLSTPPRSGARAMADGNMTPTLSASITTNEIAAKKEKSKAASNTGSPVEDDPKKGLQDNQELSPSSQVQQTTQFPTQLSETPQVSQGYYLGYTQSQVTPEPPSPAAPGGNIVAYDVGSFFHVPGAFVATQAGSGPFGGPSTPLSPHRGGAGLNTATMVGGLPPGSPLFPRVRSGGLVESASGGGQRSGLAPPSPSLPYISPQLGSSMYPASYASTARLVSQSSNLSQDGAGSWGGDRSQNAYPSPQITAQGIPFYGDMTRATSGGRAYSFEETMLPPSALDPQDVTFSPSPYGGHSGSPGGAGVYSTQQQQHQHWPYVGSPLDLYQATSAASPLQPRPAPPHVASMYPAPGGPMGVAPVGRPLMGPYGQFFPATSPGPPIQTTASNKGPDGANLFIFHIPNHFTNLDMYNLFCSYGTLLSVRIMVEKDTGRSRGFGFVSYDNPESAALAIKELNGFAIGNKRLKVQHKQIRPRDYSDRDFNVQMGYGQLTEAEGVGYEQSQSSLPPGATGRGWYGGPDESIDGKPDEGTEPTIASTNAEMPLTESPLSSLGTLQSSLPEVPSNTTSE